MPVIQTPTGPAFKQTFVRMNLDVDCDSLKDGEYRRLINGINISPFGLNGLDGVISNIVGTEQIVNANLQSTSTVIGYLEDPANNRGFFAVRHSGGNHTIYQYTGNIAIVMRTSLFAFNTDPGMIFSMTIVGDLLIFSDNTSEIKMINVVKAIAGVTYTPTLEEIVLIKRPPQLPLTLSTVNGGSTYNYVFGHYFQFYYRYVYSEDETSVFSAISRVDYPDPVIETAHDAIDVTIQANEVIPNTVKQIDYAVRVDGSNEFIIYRSDFPVAGALVSRTHRFFNTELKETISDSVSLKWNDSVPNKSAAIKFFENRLFCLNNTEGYAYPPTPVAGIAATPSTSGVLSHSFKGRGIYPVGIMFFDNYGRHAGVQIGTEVIIPERTYTTSSLRNVITWSVVGVAQAAIPLWATHYAIVIGECKNIDFFIQGMAADVFYYTDKNDGTSEFNKSVTMAPGEYLAVDITQLSQRNIGYTFNKGDKMILYGQTITPTLTRSEHKIVKQVGRFVIVERNNVTLANFEGSVHDFSNTPIFEIYREKTSIGDVYWECGDKYRITNPGTGSRAFEVTSTSFHGDIAVFNRTTYGYDGTGYSTTDPYVNNLDTLSATKFELMNAYDDIFDKWVKGTGRSMQHLNAGSKELSKKTMLRFGQEYLAGSSLNQVATFEALDEQALPSEGGAGYALSESGRVLVALQYAETTGVYVGQGFVKTTNGNNFLTKTDNVIGDVNKNLGGHGCQSPYTVVAREGRVYYLDLRRGYVIRRSQDGLTRISDYGMRSFFANICRIYREVGAPASSGKIIAGWDPKYECYVITFSSLPDGPNATVYFHEKTNSWVCFAINYPEFYGAIGTRKIDFSSGQFWIQSNNINFNNWFNNPVTRELQIEPAPDGSLEKIWTGIDIDVEEIYTPATPSSKLLVLAPTSWTDQSTTAPAPIFSATTITKTSFLTGLIKAYQALALAQAAILTMLYKVTISNIQKLTLFVSDPTPGSWTQIGGGTAWAVVGDSIEVFFTAPGVSRRRQVAVNIPAGTYTLKVIGNIVKSGLGGIVGEITIRFASNGGTFQVALKTIPGNTTAAINVNEAIVLSQAIDSIQIESEVTALAFADMTYTIDSVQLEQVSASVAAGTHIADITTILADGAGTTIDSKIDQGASDGSGSQVFPIGHELINLSGSPSGRLYIQVDNVTTDTTFDVVITPTVGMILGDTLPSAEDVVLMYEKLDSSTILTRLKYPHFKLRGSAWRAAFRGFEGDQNFGSVDDSREGSTQKVRGQSVLLRILNNNTDANTMKSIDVRYTPSMLSNP